MSRQPNLRVRVTSQTDVSEDMSSYLIQHKRFTDSQRVLAFKTMIMRGLSENRIADRNIPQILNNIPDDVYTLIINQYWESEYPKCQDDIRLLANAIASQCGMYSISGINVPVMVDIIMHALK